MFDVVKEIEAFYKAAGMPGFDLITKWRNLVTLCLEFPLSPLNSVMMNEFSVLYQLMLKDLFQASVCDVKIK